MPLFLIANQDHNSKSNICFPFSFAKIRRVSNNASWLQTTHYFKNQFKKGKKKKSTCRHFKLHSNEKSWFKKTKKGSQTRLFLWLSLKSKWNQMFERIAPWLTCKRIITYNETKLMKKTNKQTRKLKTEKLKCNHYICRNHKQIYADTEGRLTSIRA